MLKASKGSENLTITDYFKEAPFFKDILLQHGTTCYLNEGDVIVNENAYIRSIPIVISGSIKVLQTDEDGHELLLYYVEEGETCIMSFLGGVNCEKSRIKAVAEEKTEILLIPVHKLYELKEYPQWLDYLFKIYHKRYDELLQLVKEIAFSRIDERLWHLLQKKIEVSHDSVLHVTHEQLAHELGTARVVVSRLLKQLELKGIVTLHRNKIVVL